MSTTFKNVAVIGAGGNLGPSIGHALLKANFNVSAIARSSSTITFPPTIHVIKGDFSPSFLESAFRNIDAVVLSVGSISFAEKKSIIDAAAKAGVKRFIPSEFGSDTTNPITLASVPFFQSKVDVVNYLKTVSTSYPDFSWTALITGPFYDWCLKLGFIGFDHTKHHATIYDDGNGKFTTTTLSTIGSAVAAILSQPQKYGNEYLYISSFTTSQAEIFAALKKASGDKEWTVEERSTDAYILGGKEKAARGDVMGSYDLIFGTTFHGGYGGDFSAIRKISNAELGLEEESLEKVTREVYEAVLAKD